MTQINNQIEITGIILAGGSSTRFGFNKLEVRIKKVPLFIDQVFKLSFFCRNVLLVTSAKNRPILVRELKKIKHYQSFYGLNFFDIPHISVIEDEKINQEEYNRSEKSGVKKSTGFQTNVPAGPIAGLYSGLKNSTSLYNIVIAFDMPLISKNIFELLLSALDGIKDISGQHLNKGLSKKPYDAVIVKTFKGYEALCGLYSKNCTGALSENISAGIYRISDVFRQLNVKIVLLNPEINKKIDSLNFFNINSIQDYYSFTDTWNGSFSGLDFAGKWEKFFYR
ncbi:MAG: molybdenum cofactor guanylyltransferase [Actinobacteria bacterium]|nr:molybdenum cofactor guanylyltransferase [Actinomycetota bacterium]